MAGNERYQVKALVLAACLGLTGVFASLWVTRPHGLAIETDAAFYYQAAASFSTGDGFRSWFKDGTHRPLIMYPPLYSAALSLGRFAGFTVDAWARILQALLFGVNIFLVSAFAFFLVRRIWAVCLSGFLALTFVHFFELHVTAISEPVFFVPMFLSLWLLARFVHHGKARDLFIAALMAGLGMMTRYAGVSLLITVVAAAFLFSREKGFGKIRFCAGAMAAGALLPGIWILRNLRLSGEPVGFQPGLFWQHFADIGRALDTLSRYILPAMLPSALREALAILFLCAVALAVFRVWRMEPADEEGSRLRAAWRVISIYWVIHFGVAAASVIASNGAVRFDPRILIPLPASAFVLAPSFLVLPFTKRARILATIVVVIVAGLMAARALQLGVRIHRDGYGYYSREWTESRLVKAVKSLPENIPVYTNDPEAFYLYTGRNAVMIPLNGWDTAYFLPLETARERFVSGGALAVIFKVKIFRPDPLWWKLVRSAGLTVVFRDGWGEIYRVLPATGAGKSQ